MIVDERGTKTVVHGAFLEHDQPAGSVHARYVQSGVDDDGVLRAFRGQRKSFPRLGVRGAACYGVLLPTAASSSTTHGGCGVCRTSSSFGVCGGVTGSLGSGGLHQGVISSILRRGIQDGELVGVGTEKGFPPLAIFGVGARVTPGKSKSRGDGNGGPTAKKLVRLGLKTAAVLRLL